MKPCPGQLLFFCLVVTLPGALAAASGFIRAHGSKFVDEECRPFLATGVNTWEMLEIAAGVVESRELQLVSGKQMGMVQWTLASAAASSMNVMRMFAHGVRPDFSLQVSPGEYNERAFRAMDQILDEAAKLGMRVILALGDNWIAADSKPSYTAWSKTARRSDDPDIFFTDPSCRAMYRAHIKAMTHRRNTLNGRVYKDDPAIFAWDLINEPRCNCFPSSWPPPESISSCRPECAHRLQAWVEEMSAYLKTQDSRHMVTVGEEGFWGTGAAREAANPGTGWASLTGQNFSVNMAPAGIDFAAVHLWPDNWGDLELDFLESWIIEHGAEARALNKPFMVEEFGKQVHMDTPMAIANLTSSRAPFYKRVYGIYADSIAQGKDLLSGLILWAYTPHVDRELFRECRNCFAIQVTPTDYVFQDIVQPIAEAAQAAMRAAEPVKGCTPVPAKLGTRLSPHQPGLGSSKGALSSLMSALSSAGSRTALQSGASPPSSHLAKQQAADAVGGKIKAAVKHGSSHPKHHHSQLVASPASPRRHLQEA